MAEPDRSADRALVQGAIAGDEAAMRTLLEQYGGAMLGAIRQVLGARRAGWLDEEDVLQDAVVALLSGSLARYGGRASLRTFLCVIARHKAIDTIRRSAKPAGDPRNPYRIDPLRDRAPDWDPGQAEWVALHLDLFRRLDDRCFELLRRRLIDGAKPREIAVESGQRPNTVSQAVRRCVERFKKLADGALGAHA